MYKRVFPTIGIIVLFWVTNLFAQGPDTLWTKTYGGRIDPSYDVGHSVQQTSDGGYIIAGETCPYDTFNYDVYLIKTDAMGDILWEKTYGDTGFDYGQSVQQTSDGGYIIAGVTESLDEGDADVYLIKTDASGDTLWTKTYGDTSEDCGSSVQQTFDGGYIIAGMTELSGVYLIKTDANGDSMWTKTYGGLWGRSVQQTSDGGYIIAGEIWSFGGPYWVNGDVYLIKTDANGDTLWTKTYGDTACQDTGNSIQQTSDGGYIIAGGTASFSTGESDVYLIKTDANGDTLWTRTYGKASDDYGSSVQPTFDDGYIIAGGTESFGGGGIDVYLIKTDMKGDTLWTKTYGGPYWDEGKAVQQTSDGGYVIAGFTGSFGPFVPEVYNVYLIKTGPETGIEEKEPTQEVFFIFLNEPNPFNDRTLIKYELFRTINVHIVIYNLIGQKVKTLVNNKKNAGIHTVIWDGRDNSGGKITSGVYFCKIQAGSYTETRKMMLIK